MAVRLLVEGKLDLEVLTAVLQSCKPEAGGTKNTLFAKARELNRSRQVMTRYIRDRDFDFDPPQDWQVPTRDRGDGAEILGWRWTRHEMENYLLEPSIFAKVFPELELAYPTELRRAATSILAYNAARWAIGKARRELPPNYQLETRPEQMKEYALPSDGRVATQREWAVESTATFGHRIAKQLAADVVQASFDDYLQKLNDAIIMGPSAILVWFAGKDLCAALAACVFADEALSGKGLCNSLRDWIIQHPEDTLQLLPEWQKLDAFAAARA